MNRLAVADLPLVGLKLVKRDHLIDHRGFLARLFSAEELALAGWRDPIIQANHTFTAKSGTVRGMHFQRPPDAEMKLVTCIRGEIWDVAIDLRANSQTYLGWHAEVLSASNGCALMIPRGFAHGFQTLSDDVELIYFHSAPYVAASEGGLNPLDQAVGIRWPRKISEMSQRDHDHPKIGSDFVGMIIE